jgi:uncharacterized protein (TIGR00290 family)
MTLTISWSGGKDSAMALYSVLLAGKHTVRELHTVLGKDTGRVGLHGIREQLVEMQAASLGLPLTKLYLPPSNAIEDYKTLMESHYNRCKVSGIDGVVFGDIFLEDLKKFRETLLYTSGLTPVFPLWMKNPATLIADFMEVGFKALVCAADTAYFQKRHMGKTIDRAFVSTLPKNVDPCGENGEFHTFVYDGPVFNQPIACDAHQVTKESYRYKKRNDKGDVEDLESSFWFQELLPRMAV